MNSEEPCFWADPKDLEEPCFWADPKDLEEPCFWADPKDLEEPCFWADPKDLVQREEIQRPVRMPMQEIQRPVQPCEHDEDQHQEFKLLMRARQERLKFQRLESQMRVEQEQEQQQRAVSEKSCCCFGGILRKLRFQKKRPRRAAVRPFRRSMTQERAEARH